MPFGRNISKAVPVRKNENAKAEAAQCSCCPADVVAADAVEFCEQDLGRSMAQSVLELALPIVAAPQAQHVGPYLITECRQLCARPERERVVLRRGMASQNRTPIRTTSLGWRFWL